MSTLPTMGEPSVNKFRLQMCVYGTIDGRLMPVMDELLVPAIVQLVSKTPHRR
jgi:hypothetical protein